MCSAVIQARNLHSGAAHGTVHELDTVVFLVASAVHRSAHIWKPASSRVYVAMSEPYGGALALVSVRPPVLAEVVGAGRRRTLTIHDGRAAAYVLSSAVGVVDDACLRGSASHLRLFENQREE
jgi:hypothetical protein